MQNKKSEKKPLAIAFSVNWSKNISRSLFILTSRGQPQDVLLRNNSESATRIWRGIHYLSDSFHAIPNLKSNKTANEKKTIKIDVLLSTRSKCLILNWKTIVKVFTD